MARNKVRLPSPNLLNAGAPILLYSTRAARVTDARTQHILLCINTVMAFVYLLTIQEGLVLLLDVGPSMHRALQEVENVCSTLVRKKVSKYRRYYSHSKLCSLTQFIHLCNFALCSWFITGAMRLASFFSELKVPLTLTCNNRFHLNLVRPSFD
jgi:hypothetical protein